MHWLAVVVDLAMGALIARGVLRLEGVRQVIALTVEPDRTWLLGRLRLHRIIMALFVLSCVIEAGVAAFGPADPNVYVIAAISALGGVFITLGVAIQHRMSAAMSSTIADLVPICAWCKRVRVEEKPAEDPGGWISMEAFLRRETHRNITHGICADCAARERAKAAAPRG